MPPAKLKNLSVTSVDLVDQGANPDAYIRLFKRREAESETDPDVGLFQKAIYWLKKGFQDAAPLSSEGSNIVEKDAQTFSDNISREQLRAVTSEMFDNCYALSDSFCSIICDDDMDASAKEAMMLKSLDEFAQAVRSAAAQWSKGQKAEKQDGIQKSAAQQDAFAKLWGKYDTGGEPPSTSQLEEEETDTMKIDKSKMTPEEAATLAEFEKKYGVADDPVPGGASAPQDGVVKGAEPTPGPAEPTAPAAGELHPEVQKALADFQELTKRQSAEVEELKKRLEIERLTAVAQKYEVLGKNAGELAAKLYELKKAGGTVYDDYVALLDENVITLTKSGLFSELGKNTQGSAGTAQSLGIKAAELAKAAGGMSTPEAIIKAFEENPELAAQYEAEYMGGR